MDSLHIKFTVFNRHFYIEVESAQEISAHDAWDALEEIVTFMTELLTTSSQLALIVHLSRTTGGPMFALLCIGKPLIDAAFARALWDKGTFDGQCQCEI